MQIIRLRRKSSRQWGKHVCPEDLVSFHPWGLEILFFLCNIVQIGWLSVYWYVSVLNLGIVFCNLFGQQFHRPAVCDNMMQLYKVCGFPVGYFGNCKIARRLIGHYKGRLRTILTPVFVSQGRIKFFCKIYKRNFIYMI